MNTISDIIEMLPESVKLDIIDFTDVTLKTGERATRITIDRLLTVNEKNKMHVPRIVGIDCVCHYRYAPELQKSYFYVKE